MKGYFKTLYCKHEDYCGQKNIFVDRERGELQYCSQALIPCPFQTIKPQYVKRDLDRVC